jgi:hypothetical protein
MSAHEFGEGFFFLCRSAAPKFRNKFAIGFFRIHSAYLRLD